jgi:lipopolysaccharide/colanic/teichoic acid biosynthesis glycosyltransferase
MTDERDENGDLLPDSVRLTKFGRFLRSTSLARVIIGTKPENP